MMFENEKELGGVVRTKRTEFDSRITSSFLSNVSSPRGIPLLALTLSLE